VILRTVQGRILALVFAVFFVSSVAISATGLILFSSADTLTTSVGSEPNALVVYSTSARVPETSELPLKLGATLAGVQGVIAVVPEVTVPVSFYGRVVILRGLPLGSNGGPAAGNDTIILGASLRPRLDFMDGQQLSVFSFFQNRSYAFTFGGVSSSGQPYDDELTTNLAAAQTLRGFGPGTVSIFEVIVDPSKFAPQALEAAIGSPPGGQPSGAPNLSYLPLTSFSGLSPTSVVNQILGRSVGLSESVFWAMVGVVSASSLMLLYFGLSWSAAEYSGVLGLLTAIGLRPSRAARQLTALLAAVAALAGAVGYSAAFGALSLLTSLLSVRVFFHALVIQQSLGLLAFSAVFPAAFVGLVLPPVIRRIGRDAEV
jgi:hypothetical protein